MGGRVVNSKNDNVGNWSWWQTGLENKGISKIRIILSFQLHNPTRQVIWQSRKTGGTRMLMRLPEPRCQPWTCQALDLFLHEKTNPGFNTTPSQVFYATPCIHNWYTSSYQCVITNGRNIQDQRLQLQSIYIHICI